MTLLLALAIRRNSERTEQVAQTRNQVRNRSSGDNDNPVAPRADELELVFAAAAEIPFDKAERELTKLGTPTDYLAWLADEAFWHEVGSAVGSCVGSGMYPSRSLARSALSSAASAASPVPTTTNSNSPESYPWPP